MRKYFITFFVIGTFLLASCSKAQEEGSKMFDKNVRMPAVAGRFYTADKNQLEKEIKVYFDNVPAFQEDGELIALMSPHAGYVFSGQVAAYSFKRLEGKHFDTVILIGPAHTYPLRNVSVYSKGAFRTPLGDLKIDEELAEKIIKKDNAIEFIPQAHTQEHCLEVQLPFLQVMMKDFKIVPILISNPNLAETLADAIYQSVQENPNKKVLIVNSTDLSHYPPYNDAVRSDKAVLAAIESMDTERFVKTIADCESGKYEGVQTAACGQTAILTTILYAKKYDAQAIILHYANSGDSAYGEKDRVVGYGAVAYYAQSDKSKTEEKTEKDEEEVGIDMGLNQKEKEELLRIARTTIEKKVKGEAIPKFHTDSQILKETRGAFVTINKNGNLRGCIGTFVADKPLYEVVEEMAISAATRDPRFPAVNESELDKLELEISVLTPLRKIDNVEEIEVGKHGIYIIKGYNRGVLLPQVATEYGWDRITFLEHTCNKAMLPKNAWKEDDTQIYIFSAQIFHESEE